LVLLSGRGWIMRSVFVLVLLLVAAAAVLAAQNAQLVTLGFFGWHSQALSLAWVVIGSVIVGAGIASLFWLTATLKVSVRAGKLKAENRRMEKELGRRAGAGQVLERDRSEQV